MKTKKSNTSTNTDGRSDTRLWLTCEVASQLRLAEETVRRAIRDGRIAARKVGRSWRVVDEEVQRIIREGLE